MGNKVRGIVDVTAGGRVVKLQYSAEAMCALEAKDAAGRGFIEFLMNFEKAGAKLRMTDARLLLWSGMVEHQPQATLQDASALINDLGGVAAAMKVLREALQAALPEEQAGDAGNGAAAA